MKISVVMATYNGEKFIEEQINSILNQKKKPDEIVISDDCSKDKTIKIVNEYEEKFPNIEWKICINDTNLGYIKNFLNAINNASGDIIILSDQDDVWSENKISKIQSYFEKYSDMLSLHMDYSIINEEGEITRCNEIRYKNDIEKMSLQRFVSRLNYCGMSSAFRSSVKYYLNLLNVDLLPTHDWTIHAISVLQNGMYVSNNVVSYRRAHGNNVALNMDLETKRMGIKQRIEVVNGYYIYYSLIKKINALVHQPIYNDYIFKLIKTQEKRIEYLDKRNLIAWLLESKDVKYFPSLKSYICDGLYLCGLY